MSQSAFLQALGWATLNSFWQMALLWAAFLLVQHFFRLSSAQKYSGAVAGMALGFVWFIYTFIAFYQAGTAGNLLFSRDSMAPSSATWDIILSSASVAYLLLLLVPAYRLFKNWQYIEYLKKYGLEKSALEYRLFVKTVAARLGIKKPVHVYISHLITSPVTIGYIKPMILLPVAALNGLTTQQVEAVLLHELSHIRRYDYLINLIITLLHTVFYFNPFVKKFVAAIESEREKCCDEVVLQFQYDKVSYASALLTLEKNAATDTILVMAAADQKHLLQRIQKIVGQEQKPVFSFNHFAGLMTSLLLVILINSLFFVSRQPAESKKDVSFAAFENPIYGFDRPVATATAVSNSPIATAAARTTTREQLIIDVPQQEEPSFISENLVPVSYDAIADDVTEEQKEQVTATLEATRKVLTTAQWKEVEKSIADGMNEQEKVVAKGEYLKEIDKVDWKKLENKLITEYQNLDWANIQTNLGQALVSIKLDSVEKSYTTILNHLEKATAPSSSSCTATVLPLPDASVKEIQVITENLRTKLDSLKVSRTRKVVSL